MSGEDNSRVGILDRRLERLVEVTTELSVNVGRVEEQMHGLSEQLKGRIFQHEEETQRQIAENARRITTLEASWEAIEARINDLEDKPGEKARERWDRVFRIAEKVGIVVLAAVVIYKMGVG